MLCARGGSVLHTQPCNVYWIWSWRPGDSEGAPSRSLRCPSRACLPQHWSVHVGWCWTCSLISGGGGPLWWTCHSPETPWNCGLTLFRVFIRNAVSFSSYHSVWRLVHLTGQLSSDSKNVGMSVCVRLKCSFSLSFLFLFYFISFIILFLFYFLSPSILLSFSFTLLLSLLYTFPSSYLLPSFLS